MGDRRADDDHLRIGLVCPYSLTVPGGVQAQVLGLARALRTAGHTTRILAPCDGPPPDTGVTPLGNSIPTAANGSVAALAPDLPAQLRFIRALRDEDFDVLHLHEPLVPGPTMTAVVLKHTPLVATFHAAGASASYTYFGPILRRLAKRIDVKVAVSEDARSLAAELLGSNFKLLYNGIEVERFAKISAAPTEGPTIFFLGRHEPRKGLAVLLEAVAFLPADVRVWVAGDGPETANLTVRHAGDPRIEWLGRISDDEKAARLRGADVFCAPSLHGESFGVVLLEAMASSTAIVASDLPGYRNVAHPDRDAVLVPPGDAEALAGGLRRVLESPSLRADLVAAGDRRAAEFGMHHLADDYVALYRQALAGA